MIKNSFVIAASLLSALGLAQSPISLSNANMPGSGDTLRYTNVQIGSVGNYTQTGTNFNWDFSSVISGTSDVRSFKSAQQTPYSFYFLFSSNVYGEKVIDNLAGNTGSIAITNYYNFYKKSTSNPDAFMADAAGISINSLPVAAFYSDKDELYNFPLTYPKYDSTTFRFVTPSTTLIPIVYSRTGTRATRVDGWGTVITPYGQESCLRLVTTQYSKDTLAVTLSTLFPTPIKIGFVNNQRSYQWFTASSKIPFFEVTGTLLGNNFTITGARYRGYSNNLTAISAEQDISAMELYPNPVRDQLWLANAGTEAMTTELLDLNGRLIRRADPVALDKLVYLDVADLSTGLYVLRATRNNKPAYLKFIKE